MFLARPAFSIDSLLQRKVVNNHHISDKIQDDAQVEACITNPMESSATVSKSSFHQTTDGDVPISSPNINPLESLTFENILKSAAIQQQKNKGKLKHQTSNIVLILILISIFNNLFISTFFIIIKCAELAVRLPSSPTRPFPYKDGDNESLKNQNSQQGHSSSLQNGHLSTLRPPNFEQLMLLHHAQQQHKLLQQSSSYSEESR